MTRTKTVSRDKLVAYLNEYLNIAAIEDDSRNGLQVQGAARVGRVAFAVDASAQTIGAAVRSKADMLVVHHGLFWGGHQQIVGSLHKRVSQLIRNDVSLYAAHLPLDCHPEVGNNLELARLFGLQVTGRFAEYKGTEIGTLARAEKPLPRGKLKNIVERALGCPAELLPFGPASVKLIGVISGGAAKFAEEAKRLGCDALVTGESSHAAYHLARDAGINLVYGGHYATETVGLRALERHLKKRFEVPGSFISAPTGY
jgi:dinuclear metal center YbgI/SA1388 family protein